MTKFVANFIFILYLAAIPARAQEPPRSIHAIMLEAHRHDAPVVLQKVDAVIALQPRVAALSHQVYGYLPYWSSYASLDYSLLSTIAYFSIEIDGNGNVTNRHSWPNADLINRAHSRGVRLDLVATLFDDNAIHNLISNSAARHRFINNAIAEVKRGADGLNIDFEFSPAADRDLWTAFMNELALRLRAELPNAQLSMAVPAVNWSNRYDRNALARICDVLFIMGYNYYWSGSSNAGPVSPLTGGTYNITNTVNDYLAATAGNRGKLLLGCAYYGLDWPTTSEQPLAPTTGNSTARFYIAAEAMASQYSKRWYSSGQVPWFKYQSGGWRQCYYDDSTSLSKKYDLVKQKSLAGAGMWALGYDEDRTELWQALRSAFVIPTVVAQPQVASLPERLTLQPNFPNPFLSAAKSRFEGNPTTTLSYGLATAGQVKATLFNLLGQPVREILDEWQSAGEHRLLVDLRELSSGVYLLRLESGREVKQQKWLLQK